MKTRRDADLYLFQADRFEANHTFFYLFQPRVYEYELVVINPFKEPSLYLNDIIPLNNVLTKTFKSSRLLIGQYNRLLIRFVSLHQQKCEYQ
jgi:hypothetical protein